MHVVASLFSNMHFTRTHVIVLLVLLQETVASIPRHNVPMVAKASVLRPARHSLPFMSKPRWDSRPPSLLRFRRSGPEMEKRRLGFRMPNIMYKMHSAGGKRFAERLPPHREYSF
ncbi:hypothetical protein AAVH_08462 [Aphelenchoides avenae]|nr:hypothetical protein AAVH_08462 [Aphelenchus avenae]